MELTSEQLIETIKSGIKAYYDDQINTNYPYSKLIHIILGIESGLDELKANLETWNNDKNELLSLIELVDLKSIYDAYSKDGTDDEMIEKFESSISFKTDSQKYAFLSAINSIN